MLLSLFKLTHEKELAMSKTKKQDMQGQIEAFLESQGGIKNINLDDFTANLTKNIYQALLKAEIKEHLGYDENGKSPDGNYRNGHGQKSIKGSFGETQIDVPRDRQGTFDPKIIEKRSKTANSFNEKIISLYARGMTTREISGHIK